MPPQRTVDMAMRNVKARFLRNDLLLVAVLLTVAAVVMGLLLLRGNGDIVQVTVNGELYAEYALMDTLTQDICTGEASWNRLIIRDGKAFVEEASCPDGICAAHRPIYRDGESIVCLPHGVVITVKRAASEDAPDIVV